MDPNEKPEEDNCEQKLEQPAPDQPPVAEPAPPVAEPAPPVAEPAPPVAELVPEAKVLLPKQLKCPECEKTIEVKCLRIYCHKIS